jgi:hypothetical protein
MTFTLPRRTTAVTAIAVAAFSGVAMVGAAAPASAAPRAHTSLSIRAAHSSINPGGGDVISGNLAARDHHVAGRRVVLLAKASGATVWTKETVHRTGRHGGVGFGVAPTVNTRYRLAFGGNKFQQPSRSGVVVVRIRTNTTSLTIAVSPSSIAPGGSATVSGVLSAGGVALSGDTVNLLARRGTNHGFAKIGSEVTATDGSVSFSVTPAVTTHYALVFRKTATNGFARSAVGTVFVLKASSLSIRARTNHQAGTEIISGNLRGGGHALAHRKVTLQERPDGSATWTTVASRRTVHNGGVTFRQPAPMSTEDYQLVFAGGAAFSGSQSGIVTVTVS